MDTEHIGEAMSDQKITRLIAKIERTMLGFEDHGILTFFLYLTYGSGGGAQGAGGYALGMEHTDRFIRGVLQACGVDTWEKLPGRTIYVYASPTQVHAIEPLPTENGERFALDNSFDGWVSA